MMTQLNEARFLIVISTVDSIELGNKIASAAIKQKLAACVQIDGPITSLYPWEGKIEKGTEFRLMIKTIHDRYDDLVCLIKDLHSYEIPEILAIPVIAGSEEYLKWMSQHLNEREL